MFSRVVCVIRSEIILGASILDFSVCYSSHASKCTVTISYNSILLQLVACFDFNQSVNHARQYPGDGGIVEKFGSEELAKNIVYKS